MLPLPLANTPYGPPRTLPPVRDSIRQRTGEGGGEGLPVANRDPCPLLMKGRGALGGECASPPRTPSPSPSLLPIRHPPPR
jgi:hypothetical protein